MKFNIVSHSFLGKSPGYEHIGKEALIGGGEVYLYDFAKFLQKEGNEVTIIQAMDVNSVFEYEGLKIKGVRPTTRIAGSKGMIERYGLFNLAWKNHIDKDVDRVHLHDYLHAYPYANKNMTGTCHGITWDCPRFMQKGLGMKAYRDTSRKLACFAIGKLKKVVANDNFLLRFVQSEMPQYRDKIEVILNYVDLAKFNPDIKPSQRQKYPDRKIILYPRNFNYGRGGLNAVKAMKSVVEKHPEAILLMTGEGFEKQVAKKYAYDNNLEDNVVFLGHQDHFKDMPGLFASADVVIVPTECSEGTSLSALEAMATGKPVVVSNIGGLPDIVINELNGLLVKPNPESLAEGIIRYLDEPEFAKRMALSGQK